MKIMLIGFRSMRCVFFGTHVSGVKIEEPAKIEGVEKERIRFAFTESEAYFTPNTNPSYPALI